MPNGKIQPEFGDTLAVVGDWMKTNGKSIYGTRGNVIEPQPWGVVTAKNKTLYAHVLTMPNQHYIFLPQLAGKVTKAALMSNGTSVKFKQQPEGVFVYLDKAAIDATDTIVELTTN